MFSRAIKTRPPDPLPLELHGRGLWFFISLASTRPRPLLYGLGWAGYTTEGQEATTRRGQKSLPKTLSERRRLAAVFQAAYARKHRCFRCKKGLCCPSSTTFCVGQTAVYTERLTGRYVRSKREGVFGKDFCPGRVVLDCLKIVLRVGFGCCEWGGGVVDFW